jgi:hypothetical protein
MALPQTLHIDLELIGQLVRALPLLIQCSLQLGYLLPQPAHLSLAALIRLLALNVFARLGGHDLAQVVQLLLEFLTPRGLGRALIVLRGEVGSQAIDFDSQEGFSLLAALERLCIAHPLGLKVRNVSLPGRDGRLVPRNHLLELIVLHLEPAQLLRQTRHLRRPRVAVMSADSHMHTHDLPFSS